MCRTLSRATHERLAFVCLSHWRGHLRVGCPLLLSGSSDVINSLGAQATVAPRTISRLVECSMRFKAAVSSTQLCGSQS